VEDVAQSQRQAIRDAALAELITGGIDKFTVGGVARRAGVDPSVIVETWRDRRLLLMDAQLSRASSEVPTPNTGTLRGDLVAYATSLIELAASPEGRTWFKRLLPASGDADLAEIRADFWQVRFDAVAPILERAAERGELRDGVDPLAAIRMFSAGLWFDVIFTDTAVDPNHAAQALDIFIHGITA